jgi:hypothetical protein
MDTCRCFFMDEADHIQAAEIIEAAAIDEIIEKARAMLQAQQYRAVEIWQGERRLYRIGELEKSALVNSGPPPSQSPRPADAFKRPRRCPSSATAAKVRRPAHRNHP